jgi:hypothetical protein
MQTSLDRSDRKRFGMTYSDPSLRRLKHGRIRPMADERSFLQRLLSCL